MLLKKCSLVVAESILVVIGVEEGRNGFVVLHDVMHAIEGVEGRGLRPGECPTHVSPSVSITFSSIQRCNTCRIVAACRMHVIMGILGPCYSR